MFEKVQFSRSKLSDFWGFSPDKAKTAPFGSVFKNGVADKKVRAVHTAHSSGRLINSPSILRRKIPARRFRTYDPALSSSARFGQIPFPCLPDAFGLCRQKQHLEVVFA